MSEPKSFKKEAAAKAHIALLFFVWLILLALSKRMTGAYLILNSDNHKVKESNKTTIRHPGKRRNAHWIWEASPIG
jgi:hypothetical protein